VGQRRIRTTVLRQCLPSFIGDGEGAHLFRHQPAFTQQFQGIVAGSLTHLVLERTDNLGRSGWSVGIVHQRNLAENQMFGAA
jgi:hypothetical protein